MCVKTILKDGYWIEQDQKFPAQIQWGKGSKTLSARADSMQPVVHNSLAAKSILEAGNKLEDYLSNHTSIVRWNEQTKPIIEAAIRFGISQQAENESKFKREADARASKEAAQKIEDAPKLAALIAQIPTEAVRVTVVQNGSLDGDPILDYSINGLKLSWSDCTILGWVGDEAVCFISRARLSEIETSEREAAEKANEETQRKNAERAAKFEQARTSGHPVILERWTENRRSLECGQWGDYQFICSKMALPDGTTKINAVNSY